MACVGQQNVGGARQTQRSTHTSHFISDLHCAGFVQVYVPPGTLFLHAVAPTCEGTDQGRIREPHLIIMILTLVLILILVLLLLLLLLLPLLLLLLLLLLLIITMMIMIIVIIIIITLIMMDQGRLREPHPPATYIAI